MLPNLTIEACGSHTKSWSYLPCFEVSLKKYGYSYSRCLILIPGLNSPDWRAENLFWQFVEILGGCKCIKFPASQKALLKNYDTPGYSKIELRSDSLSGLQPLPALLAYGP